MPVTYIFPQQMSPRTLKRELEKNSDDETPGKKRKKSKGLKRTVDQFGKDALKRQLYSLHGDGII
jgi:hypothetical protein